MAWTYEQTFNALTDGDLNGQDSWSGSTRFDVTTNAAARYEGAKGIEIAYQTGEQTDDIVRAVTAISAGIVYVSVKRTGTAANLGHAYITLRESGAGKMFVRFASGQIMAYDNGTYRQSGSLGAYSADTWYRIGVEFDNSAQANKFRVNVNGGTWSDWYTVNGGSYTNINEIRLTASDAQAANTGYFDFVSPTYATGLTVQTDAATDISDTGATHNGQILTIGSGNATHRGFVWGTTSQSNPGDVAPDTTDYDFYVDFGGSWGTGAFSNVRTTLTSETTYYVRAFAGDGDGYVYGDEISYTTEAPPPPVYAISGVVSLNGSPVTGATVRCIRQSDNTILTAATTNASGEYSFSDLDNTELYHVAVEYEAGEQKYNALSLWDVAPVEV